MTMPIEADQPGEPGMRTMAARPLPAFSKALHWLMAGFVLGMIGSGVVMKQLSGGPASDALYSVHKTCGVAVLMLALMRLGYRLTALTTGSWPRGSGDRLVHVALYACLIAVPLLGWAGVSDFGARDLLFGYTLPSIWPEGAGYADQLFFAHALLAFTMIGLVFTHVGIALNDYIHRGSNRR